MKKMGKLSSHLCFSLINCINSKTHLVCYYLLIYSFTCSNCVISSKVNSSMEVQSNASSINNNIDNVTFSESNLGFENFSTSSVTPPLLLSSSFTPLQQATTRETSTGSTISTSSATSSSSMLATANIINNNIEETTDTNSSSDDSHGDDVQLSPTLIPTEILDLETPQVIDSSPIQGWRARCYKLTIGSEQGEIECRCEGTALVRIPQRLPATMQKLIISKAGITLLRNTGLRVYSLALQDIMFTDLQEFESIETGAFADLKQLRTIYISHAPKLTNLTAEVFQGISKSFRSLRILYCGLLRIPDMRFLPTGTILYMLDLEANQIAQVDESSVRIKTEQLILDNNPLTYINKSAFQGSEIAKLSFKGNYKLKTMHKLAFDGIINIRELDLSSTSIEDLPAEGLNTLEILRIQNTHSLKTIPSVYNFKNLRVAWLTHPFHCCAFKFPSRHDPYRHAQRLQYLAELQKTCLNSKYNSNVDEKTLTATVLQVHENLNGNENLTTYQHEPIDDGNNINNSINDDSTWTAGFQHIGGNTKRLKRFVKSTNKSIGSEFHNHFEDEDSNNRYRRNKSNAYYENENYYINPITGSPINMQDKIESDDSSLMTNNLDFGEFHETTANVHPNILAICGKLSKNIITVQCYPMPDALNPCEDVMGSQWLRVSVWIVVSLAVFGNVAVLIVLCSNWSDVTVPKFLMSNLAFADLCLGLYLVLIAAIDVHSMGEYFNFAYDWQYGSGCKAAGFLTVFASHLSVFTLTLITVERWFAITNAINLNKRIKIKPASVIMVFGWIYSIVMSSLPLFGVSNYSSTSICLPMEARDFFDVVYLVLIIGINGIAFFVIAICYGQIYFSLGKETRQAARNASRGEMTMAKKMALLVFTNFACWAPIAFFGLTALAGIPLIDVAKSKILLVFFYPLNSCADPYLYAILTAQYRRDLFMLLSKYGFFKQKAQQYKLNYSMPTTNHTCPIPLIGRNNSMSERNNSVSKNRKTSTAYTDLPDEDYV